MDKILMGPQTLIYPMPTLLVGANIDDKPNFMTVAWGGIANSEPPMISVAIRHIRHTLKGIRQNEAFSVNIPSAAKVDKVEACQFEVFYGELDNAPLIEQCPVNLECKVIHILDLGSHALVVGRIEETHVSQSCLTDGKPDVNKIKPITYIMSPVTRYQALGEVLAKAFSVGRELKPRQ